MTDTYRRNSDVTGRGSGEEPDQQRKRTRRGRGAVGAPRPLHLDTLPELRAIVELAHRAKVDRPALLRRHLDGKVSVVAGSVIALEPSTGWHGGGRRGPSVVFGREEVMLERRAERRVGRGCTELDVDGACARARSDAPSRILRRPRRT